MAAKNNISKRRRNTAKERRGTYTHEQKKLVLERYQYCITRQEKLELAQELGMETLEQLYNLANRLKATKQQNTLEDLDRSDHIAFDDIRRSKRQTLAETTFTEEDNAYLIAHFGKQHVEEIAFHRGHTETAILYRARQLKLRNYCKYWPLQNALAWLSLETDTLQEMGMQVYACKDRDGKVAIELVSTSSLMRMIDNPLYEIALQRAGADEFFLQEIRDLLTDHKRDKVQWEVSRWISHGHICLNPWAMESFGLFDNGNDHLMPGRELYPDDLV